MTTGQLILLLVLILVVAVVVVVLVRRRAAKREAARVEAATLRTEAETIAARMTGLSTFAEQASERAEVARLEAEQKAREAEEQAREAARLEEEAAAQRTAAEDTQREYEATMRRADDVDPDVRESAFAATEADQDDEDDRDGVPEGTDVDTDHSASPTDADRDASADHDGAVDETDATPTRAEQREAREQGTLVDVDGDTDVDADRDGVADRDEATDRHDVPDGRGVAGPDALSERGTVVDRGDEAGHTASDDVREREGMPGAAPLGVGLAAGAAAGAAAWGNRDDERDPESERIASAADFRDDVPTDAPPQDVYAAPVSGSGRGMSDQSAHETTQPATENDQDDVSRDTESPRGEWGGPREEAGTPSTADDGDSMTIVEPEDFAATEPLMAADQSPPVEPTPVTEPDVREQYAAATSDGSASQGDFGHGSSGSEGRDPDSEVGNADNAVVIGDTDAYASTEPLLAGDSTPGAQHDAGADSSVDEGVGANDTDRGDRSGYGDGDRTEVGDRSEAGDRTEYGDGDRSDAGDRTEFGDGDRTDLGAGTDVHAPAEAGGAVAEPVDGDASRTAHEPAEERFDPTPTRDWAADEGALLDENQERADRLAEERAELEPDVPPVASAGASRRISSFEDLRDGGFGVGSAAPLGDGVQPLDHPVQGFRESMTFQAPGDSGYDSAEPDVWFYDVESAERSGFRRSDG